MTGKHKVCAIAQMRGQRRARLHGLSDLLGRGRRMADGNLDTTLGAAADEVGAVRPLGRKGDDADAPARSVLPALENFPIRRTNMLARVSAARSVFGGDEGAF